MPCSFDTRQVAVLHAAFQIWPLALEQYTTVETKSIDLRAVSGNVCSLAPPSEPSFVHGFVTSRVHFKAFRTLNGNRHFAEFPCRESIEMSHIPTGEIIDFAIRLDSIEKLIVQPSIIERNRSPPGEIDAERI